MPSIKQVIAELLEPTGIVINGKNPWDIQVHNEHLYQRVLSGGSLALGESYMDGWWDVENLDEFFDRILKADLDTKVVDKKRLVGAYIKARAINMQSKKRSKIVGEVHYDIGNDLYSLMLDKWMAYSCGYWKTAKDLNQAQEAKLDLICRKVGLKKGMTVLDIGCGWGSFAKFAAERYGAQVYGITISKEQATLARKRCKGLPVKIVLKDYRDVPDTKIQFDRVISIGMIEHVGHKNFRKFMEIVHSCLKDDGLFLLHTIGGNKSVKGTDPWISKYIFPNSMLPSAAQLTKASEGLFVLEDWHSFGQFYDKTLMAWHKNFVRHWPKISEQYDDRFFRMWTYYLLSCAGTFRARKNQLWQIVYSKKGIEGGYFRLT